MFKSHEVSVSPLMLVLSLVCLAGDAQDGSDLAALDGPGSGATVVINELLANSQGSGPDWIELHNTTTDAIDIGGWFLSDDANDVGGRRGHGGSGPGLSLIRDY